MLEKVLPESLLVKGGWTFSLAITRDLGVLPCFVGLEVAVQVLFAFRSARKTEQQPALLSTTPRN